MKTTISYIFDISFKNSSTYGLFKTCTKWLPFSTKIFNRRSAENEKGLNDEWTKVSSKSNINVFLLFSDNDGRRNLDDDDEKFEYGRNFEELNERLYVV